MLEEARYDGRCNCILKFLWKKEMVVFLDASIYLEVPMEGGKLVVLLDTSRCFHIF